VNLLLDAHAFLWWLAGEPMQSEAASLRADPDAVVAVSAATVWEIAIKRALGKLRLEGTVADHVRSSGFEPLGISVAHAQRAWALPAVQRDPFDRMLVAQAQAERLAVVTRDAVFSSYEVPVLRC